MFYNLIIVCKSPTEMYVLLWYFAFCGIFAASFLLYCVDEGKNDNSRVYSIINNDLRPLKTHRILSSFFYYSNFLYIKPIVMQIEFQVAIFVVVANILVIFRFEGI